MKTKSILAFILFSIAAINLQATDYYISNDGDDNHKGTSPKTAFRTIERINKINLHPGDNIYFRCGDVFIGTLIIKQQGGKKAPIQITSYGEGEKPVISGGKLIDDFHMEGKIASAVFDEKIGYLYRENTLLTKARYPNSGFLKMDDGGTDYLMDFDLPFTESQLIGTTVRMRINDWQFEYREVVSYQDYKLKFDSILFNKQEYISTCKPGWGYYLDNSKLFLDFANEWYYSDSKNKVLIYTGSTHKPSGITASFINSGIILYKEVSNIRVNNLSFKYQVNEAVILNGNNNNISITNCNFSRIGKYGIKGKNGCANIKITENRFDHILGGGIHFIEVSHSNIAKNHLTNIGLHQGYGIDGVNGAVAIAIINEEKSYDDLNDLSNSNQIAHNYIDSIGYMCIRMDGHKSVCEYNVMKNGMLSLNDGGMFHCWGVDTSYTYNNIIRKNIIINSVGNTEGAVGHHLIRQGIYIDNKCKDIEIRDNIVTKTGTALLINSPSFRIQVSNNLCYDNKQSLGISEWNKPKGNFGNHITRNQFILTGNMLHTTGLANHRGTMLEPGVIDSNLYSAPREKYHIKTMVVEEHQKLTRELTLAGWTNLYGHDKNSTLFVPEINGKKYQLSILHFNENDKEKEIVLDNKYEYINLEGEIIRANPILKPFEGIVLFYTLKDSV